MTEDTKTLTLTEFLLARIAEDEAEARKAGPMWRNEWSAEDVDVTLHIERHDPARVLAECEAKRRIVANHGGRHICEDGMAGERWDDELNDLVEAPCEDLCIIGAIYDYGQRQVQQ